jgi:hypothetical protein
LDAKAKRIARSLYGVFAMAYMAEEETFAGYRSAGKRTKYKGNRKVEKTNNPTILIFLCQMNRTEKI